MRKANRELIVPYSSGELLNLKNVSEQLKYIRLTGSNEREAIEKRFEIQRKFSNENMRKNQKKIKKEKEKRYKDTGRIYLGTDEESTFRENKQSVEKLTKIEMLRKLKHFVRTGSENYYKNMNELYFNNWKSAIIKELGAEAFRKIKKELDKKSFFSPDAFYEKMVIGAEDLLEIRYAYSMEEAETITNNIISAIRTL